MVVGMDRCVCGESDDGCMVSGDESDEVEL